MNPDLIRAFEDDIQANPEEAALRLAYLDYLRGHADAVRSWIVAVATREPALNINGFGLGWLPQGTPAERKRRLAMCRNEIAFPHERTVDAFARCLVWIAGVKRINHPAAYSYTLKHVVEDCFRDCLHDSDQSCYVSNGTFIAAGIHAGLTWKCEPGRCNADFGISRKSYRRKNSRGNYIFC